MPVGAERSTRAHTGAELWSKVPLITVLFWVIKILTTGMGEVTSDWATHSFPRALAVVAGFFALLASLLWQLAVRRYIAAVYWLAIVMVSVFGTMVADVVHLGLGVPYVVSTTVFSVVLATVFVVWHRVEGTLSIHSIRTRRRELFYWATVLATFALGTAAGDMTATTLSLGFFASGVLFAVLFAIPAVAHLWFGLDAVAAFWAAYVLTRPLGASFADWMAVPPSRGGLDWGYGPVALVLTVVIVVLVAYLAVSRRDVEVPEGAPVAPDVQDARA